MSHTDRHQITLFKSGASKPLTGQDLVVVGYKPSTNKQTKQRIPAKYPSVCVSVPKFQDVDLRANVELLRDMLLESLHEARKGIIKSLYEASNGTNVGESIADEDLNIAACVAYLESQQKFDKVAVATWFNENINDALRLAIAVKLSFVGADAEDLSGCSAEQVTEIDRQAGIFAEHVLTAATGKPSLMTDSQRRSVTRAFEIADCDDATARRILRRMEPREREQKITAEALEI